MDRIFHQRLTLSAKCGIVLFSLLALWFFWNRQAALGLIVMIVVVGMTEHVLHTVYIFRSVEEDETLIIDHGRFSMKTSIPVNEIIRYTHMKGAYGLSGYLALEYGNKKMISVLPTDEQAFIAELKKRQNTQENKTKQTTDHTLQTQETERTDLEAEAATAMPSAESSATASDTPSQPQSPLLP